MLPTDSLALSSGFRLPKLGCRRRPFGKLSLWLVGTYRIRGDSVAPAVSTALSSGYRLFDTAAVYRNESEIGAALRDCSEARGIRRDDIFVTSKLAPRDHGYDACIQAIEKSVSELGLGYIDLYLIHWPGKQKLKHHDPQNASSRAESWRALEDCVDRGLVRSIGVSNYTIRHLTELLAHCRIRPAVLQTEIHPMHPERELAGFCRDQGIALQAYSSLGEGRLVCDNGAAIPGLDKMCSRYQRSPAQVLLRWAWQHDYAVIPKSTNPERIASNAKLDFVIPDEDMLKLDELTPTVQDTRFCWDPTAIY